MCNGTCSVGSSTRPSGNSPTSMMEAYALSGDASRRSLEDQDRDGRQEADDGDEPHAFDPRRAPSGDPEGFVRIPSGRRARRGQVVANVELRGLPDEPTRDTGAREAAERHGALELGRAVHERAEALAEHCEPEVLETEDEPHDRRVARVAREQRPTRLVRGGGEQRGTVRRAADDPPEDDD